MNRNHVYSYGFDGFYCSVFDPQLEDWKGEYDALFWKATPEKAKLIQKEMQENIFDYFDMKSYQDDVAKGWVDAFENQVTYLDGLENLSLNFVAVNSPAYYNYTTDKIEIEIKGLSRKVLRSVAKLMKKHEDKLRERIKDDWTPYDGFISFMSNSYDFWLKLFECDRYTWKQLDKSGPYIYDYLNVALYYICELESPFFYDALIDGAMEDHWEWCYVDYDKMFAKLGFSEKEIEC